MSNGHKKKIKPMVQDKTSVKKKRVDYKENVLSGLKGESKRLKDIMSDIETGRVRNPISKKNMTASEKKALGEKIKKVRKKN